MPGEVDAKELLDKLGAYHAEIVALARETTASVATLETTIRIVRDSKPNPWIVHKNLITFVVSVATLLLFIVGVAITMSHTNLCVVNVAGADKTANLTSCRK